MIMLYHGNLLALQCCLAILLKQSPSAHVYLANGRKAESERRRVNKGEQDAEQNFVTDICGKYYTISLFVIQQNYWHKRQNSDKLFHTEEMYCSTIKLYCVRELVFSISICPCLWSTPAKLSTWQRITFFLLFWLRTMLTIYCNILCFSHKQPGKSQ